MKRSYSILLIICIALALFTAACGSSSNNGSSNNSNQKETVTIQLPTTTDQMLAFEKSYAQQHPGQYGIVWPTQDAYYNAPWFYGFGAFYVKPDGTVGLNTPQATAAGNFIASFRPYLPKQLDGTTASSLFTSGKAPAIIDGPWSYAD